MKYRLVLMFIVLSIFSFQTINVFAKDNEFISNSITYSLDNPSSNSNFDENNYNKDQDCVSMLGNTNDEESVAWLIQEALNIIRVIGPLLVLILSGFDFIKVIFTGDEKAMKDAQRKLFVRLILAGCLFALPSIISWLLEFFHITNSTCGIQ
ncbi:MAG: hypothetical protein IKE70_04455 [Bacilli bacterium]|nr:hypothetical protein [Bacilli bacterium]